MTATERVSRWLDHEYETPSRALASFRIVFAAVVLWVLPPLDNPNTSFLMFADLPAALFDPPAGPIALLDEWPSRPTCELLDHATRLCAISLLAGWHTRLVSLGLSVLLLVFYGLVASLGKVDHAALFCLAPGILAFSGWGSVASVDALLGRSKPTSNGRPLAVLAYTTAFAMATAGLAKLGWLNPFTFGTKYHATRQLIKGRTDLLAVPLSTHLPDFGWELLDWSTVAVELAPLLLVRRRRWFVASLGAVVCFHFGVALVLNIAFVVNVVVYAAFVRWPSTPLGTMSIAASLPTEAAAAVLVVFLSLLHAISPNPLLFLDSHAPLHSDMRASHLVVIVLAMVSLSVLLLRQVFPLPRRSNRPSRES